MNVETTKGSYLSGEMTKGSYLSGEVTKGSYLSGEMTKGSYLSDEITKGSYVKTSNGMNIKTDKDAHKMKDDDLMKTNEYDRAYELLYGRKRPKKKAKEPPPQEPEPAKEEPKTPTPPPPPPRVETPPPDIEPIVTVEPEPQYRLPSNATGSVMRSLSLFSLNEERARTSHQPDTLPSYRGPSTHAEYIY